MNGFVEKHEKLEVLCGCGPFLIYIFQRTWNLVDRVGDALHATQYSSSKLSLHQGLVSNLIDTTVSNYLDPVSHSMGTSQSVAG